MKFYTFLQLGNTIQQVLGSEGGEVVEETAAQVGSSSGSVMGTLGGILSTGEIWYFIFAGAALVLTLWAQSAVKSRFAKYDKVKSKKNITGAQAANYLLQQNGITDVKIAHISGNLTDNYNPTTKVLSLSDSTYASTSIAAIGVAAHETGHAIQHNVGYNPIKTRSALVPVANLGSQFGPIVAVAGISMVAAGVAFGDLLIKIGLGLFAGAVAFYLVTLPVEFNASRRALKILESGGVMDKDELSDTRKVLSAAAMTYVASAFSAIGSFIRLLVMSKSSKRR